MAHAKHRRIGLLTWIGFSCAFFSGIAGLVVVLFAQSMPQRTPTGEDFTKSCTAFILLGAMAALTMGGGVISLVELVRVPSQGRARTAPALALALNGVPWVIGFAGDIFRWWV
jgi:hypothetical protein